ncbi:hypothetical protein PENTCL1PPCAC_30389, partial [Pristionchus entomophagus]
MRVNGDDRGADSPLVRPSSFLICSALADAQSEQCKWRIVRVGPREDHSIRRTRCSVRKDSNCWFDRPPHVRLSFHIGRWSHLPFPPRFGSGEDVDVEGSHKGRREARCRMSGGRIASALLELLVPVARKLSGSCEDQCGVQHLAILAFWYVLLGVAHRKSFRKLNSQDGDGSHDASMDLLAVKTTVRFELPSCVGLGSSGAFCVCIVTSLLQSSGLIPPPTIVADAEGNLTWEEEHLDMSESGRRLLRVSFMEGPVDWMPPFVLMEELRHSSLARGSSISG